MPSMKLLFSKKRPRPCVCVISLLMVLVVWNIETVVNTSVANSLDRTPTPARDKGQGQPPKPNGNGISSVLVTVRTNASIKAGARHKNTLRRPKPIRRPDIADYKNRNPHRHPLLMLAKRPLNKTKHDIMGVVSSL